MLGIVYGAMTSSANRVARYSKASKPRVSQKAATDPKRLELWKIRMEAQKFSDLRSFKDTQAIRKILNKMGRWAKGVDRSILEDMRLGTLLRTIKAMNQAYKRDLAAGGKEKWLANYADSVFHNVAAAYVRYVRATKDS